MTDSGKSGETSPSDPSPPPLHPSASSSSIPTSPPVPPPDFNPPANISNQSIESTIGAISPPPLEPFLPMTSPGAVPSAVSSGFMSRPALQALQRNDSGISSNDSSASSGVFSSGSQSDGGEHLIEARNDLLSQSGHTSREDSEEEEEELTSTTPRYNFDINVVTATPPLQPGDMDQPRRYSGGESSRDQTWDSVWPTPDALARANSYSLDTPSSSRYPRLTPVSPFVTPSFSPAIFPAGSSRPAPPPLNVPIRRSSSPSRRAQSPRRPSPHTSYSETFDPPDNFLHRRRSITAIDVPPLMSPSTSATSVSISKHGRSLSTSNDLSPNSRTSFSTIMKRPQPSPPQSPRATAPDRPDSPARRRKHTLPAPASGRLTELGSSPFLRPRAQSSTTRESPMMAPEEPVAGPSRISPRARTPTSPTQKLPDDDIPPLDSRSEGLPPAVASSPLFPPDTVGDDGLFSFPIDTMSQSAPSPPLAPLARPANLRRALSDYQTRSPRTAPMGMSRSSSLTSDLDKSPKRPGSAGSVEGMDRPRKSPKVSPRSALPEVEDLQFDPPEEVPIIDQIGDVPLVDEGDVLPQDTDLYMDITFEDEGLNTLERIFLLSKSDFAFHRAYIARVLGDLLYDVDPCESVEYVLPLISSFTLDDDEGVREAFAQDLHRIIWYFYSVCRITPAGTEAEAPGAGVYYEGYGQSYGEEEYPEDQLDPQSVHSREDSNQTIRPAHDQTITVTSEGLGVADKPTTEEIRAATRIPSPPQSIVSGPTSGTSTMSKALTTSSESGTDDTPATSISDARRESIDAEVFLPDESDKTEARPILEGPLLERPTLPVDFFTPLLGSLLLNANTIISESVRAGLVYLIARLKGKGELTAERWGTILNETEEPRAFIGQTGPHNHEVRPIPSEEKDMLERELLEGLVVGMGRLSTEMPDHLYDEGMTLEDSHAVLESYAEPYGARSARSSLGSGSEVSREKEAFQAQLIAEATAGRATSMNLIGALCDYYTGPEVVSWGFVDEVLKCRDGDVPVRAEGAVALSMLAKVAPVEHVYSFIPLFELLANDDLPQVRQSACLSLPSLCRRIESADYRRSFAVKAIHSLTTFNADVRCAALEVLGELIYVFADDSRGPPMELMQVYLDEEDVRRGFGEDWDTVASFNFPGVALTLGADRWSHIQPLYQRIHERAGEKSRRTLAASLHELAKILTPEQCAKDLMPVYHTCVTGIDEIRELVFEHIDVFLDRLPLDLAWETYLELAQAWKEDNLGGWRAREQLALHIPAFFKTFHNLMDDQVLGMLKDALLDPFAAVRDAATKGIPEAYEILGDESDIARRFRDNLLSLGKSSRFRQRQTFVRCLREFVKPPPNRQAFEDFFLPFLGSLSRDVVDVRLGLAQTVADLFVVGAFYADKVHAPKAILDLAKLLTQDEAVDVRNTIKHVNLDHLEENDTVPYEIKSPKIAKRAVLPSDLVPDHAPVQPAPLPEDSALSEDAGSPTNDRPEHSPGTSGSGTPRNPKPRSSPSDGQTSQPLISPTTGVFHHRIRIDRRPSAEMTKHMEKMQLDTSLLTPTTPGTARIRNRARARESGEGHYISSPSPNEPAGGMDPFSISFAQATPEGSPAAQTRGLESPGSSTE